MFGLGNLGLLGVPEGTLAPYVAPSAAYYQQEANTDVYLTEGSDKYLQE